MLWRDGQIDEDTNMSRWLNLDLQTYLGTGKYNIPDIAPTTVCDPSDWMGFNYCLSNRKIAEKKAKTGVHFFLADGQFERCWKNPRRYGEMLKAYNCVMSPDFSLYSDFPLAVQIWNHYRKHWIARYWQDMGLTVIPTIAWSTPESYDFCFDGEPKGGIVAVSNIGCIRSETNHKLFRQGYEEMLRRLEPSLILFYAHKMFDYPGNIRYIHFSMDKGQEAY